MASQTPQKQTQSNPLSAPANSLHKNTKKYIFYIDGAGADDIDYLLYDGHSSTRQLGDPTNLGNGYTYVGNNPASYVDPFGFQAAVKFGPPKGTKRTRYNFRFKAASVKGVGKANIVISSRNALRVKKGTPVAELLTKCKVIIISGGAANIKKA